MGEAPASRMRDYQREVTQYARGNGILTCTLKGYWPCHNTQEVMAQCGYDPERDLENAADSVFCAHGAGFVVKWHQVKEYMHLETPPWVRKILEQAEDIEIQALSAMKEEDDWQEEAWIGEDEVEAILSRTSGANRKDAKKARKSWNRKSAKGSVPVSPTTRSFRMPDKKEEYFLVDGYNIIFAWQELKELAELNIDSARGRLLDIMCNYQGMRGAHLIVVFDAYRVQQRKEEVLDYHNIHVVFTKEAETADQYIEKFAHQHAKEYRVTVATSDGLEQIIIRGQGCGLISARELQQEILDLQQEAKERFLQGQGKGKTFLGESMPKEMKGSIV